MATNPEEVRWDDSELAIVKTARQVDLLAAATPNEMIASGIFPTMLNCLTVGSLTREFVPISHFPAFDWSDKSSTTSSFR